jgi:hypothetical protein
VLIVFEEEEKSSSTFLKKLTALALIALLPIGATLASNISLGNNSAVEFGQGVKKLVTCAPNVPIFLKPRNTFVNSAGTGAHYKFTGISIEGIQNTCVGFDFVIRAYGESGSPLPIFDTNKTEIRIYQSLGDAFSTNASDGITFSDVAFGQFVATFDAPVSASTEVYRITIETFPHDTSMLRYAVGDTGPAGGYIFLTPNSAGNNTGLYFEAKNHGGGEIWCDQYPADVTAATGSSIGTGDANTSAINSICNDGAAFEARYWAGSPNDWYLPSTGELSAVFAAGFIPTFGASYWTSTQYDEDNAYVVTWPGQAVNVTDKIMGNPLVAVRSFS